ncbi:MAG: alpha-L-fucosidase [Planctomycetaceae bacterium]|nr:alpha-L-fucosidase [Planctomycetaceae bacterium]
MKNLIKILLPAAFFCAFLTVPVFPQDSGGLPIAEGSFKPTDESLATYQCPDWFRDAKFGIWSHWGPASVARAGGWYAQRMYQEGSREYKRHVNQYGHPSEFGYKDVIHLWKAERWNPNELMKLYKKAGAKYFVCVGVHHDNFFLWNSKLHRWNSVNMGPKKDVAALWQQAAKKEGLYFGLSEHVAASYTWLQKAKGSDKNGDKAGILYDGANPEFYDLYHEPAAPDDKAWFTKNPKWQRQWFDRVQELIDNYHPDLFYSDGKLPFDRTGREFGRGLVAHYYNQGAKTNSAGVVYNCKEVANGRWVADYERAAAADIQKEPWQTDSCISGEWYYSDNIKEQGKYKTGEEIIQMLVDIVSKNGNLLLNVPLTPEGEHDAAQLKVLETIADWFAVNGEAIYGTRPWTVFGEGTDAAAKHKADGHGPLKGVWDTRKYQADDLRFTTKGNALYVFCMEKPAGDVVVKTPIGKKVSSVKLLGSGEAVQWTQNETGLTLRKPENPPKFKTIVYKMTLL